MVSTQIRNNLIQAYEAIKEQSLNFFDYEKPMSDIAFEIISAETYIAGLAERIIDHQSLTNEEISILENKLLSGSHWNLNDGSVYSIEDYYNLLKYARNIEKLRCLCLKCVKSMH